MPRKKIKNLQAPRGTYDILPENQIYWDKIRRVVKELGEDYGFLRIDTPIIEDTDLFIRGTGQTTDIVQKQMYSFKTLGGDSLTLRPEGTPGVIRAYIENGMINLLHPLKFYYFGPMFRYEHPQAGRYRQFYQFGFETIGGQEPVLDVQLIQLFLHILRDLGLKKINVQINSLGCPECRPAFRRALVDYYRSRKNKLCPNCQKRLKINPLRLLDCKEEKCQPVKASAPMSLDYLCSQCHNHFKSVLEFLDELEIPYFLNHQLVRGLDYYTKTVFEVWPESNQGPAENQDTKEPISLGGGGRYDNLVKRLGGKPTPAAGFAAGIERIISLIKQQGMKIPSKSNPKVFLVQLGELGQRKSMKLFEELHKAEIKVAESISKPSIKSQLKIADKIGVRFSLIVGQQEALDRSVIIRDMQSGVQETVPRDKVVKELKKRLSKK
ncbi:MAG: histidine--tRNA ligase [Parcubacteria group bacterium CG1_02_40_82]|uniref:Histidine--tRNA ligase n=4 Tax=Candidatus Portnoyibacteriota TaxID=1817913 RepID=A0A2M7IHU8_9BACT|nr:MAG: histidine--tRNA ligase [Parcubacteria group bacterium CG1_02_40_82]PIQ75380.1 MAG: histidine--tRNA ligase [Candidatus Portnoybacteria bacterium CG11_big_fil_rev_8_21_14_0_20_40_15]PIS31511.1 MAG: histidine--tRNA ligase [Candidatus Portnoybacteria bacterium CG08_land_8_20_14_0_20_40_83]PIW76100.1 MAG: histidine--tRNA ligase [Candidatus Portnoybacteria bacterium CG_4_8_14_3_um_filter_40_10]PIY74863.1 MAG: histidine--tRNA ligase [Candidatus Portnoybacteria bacterium CG_4_10_14_0_8_um_filte